MPVVLRESAHGQVRHSETLRRGEGNEYLDNSVRDSADCMDFGFHGVSRGRRPDPLAPDFRGDFLDLALCDGQKRGLRLMYLNWDLIKGEH